MTQVLGFPLADAVRILTEEGYTSILRESRCKRGVDGCDKRVIRQALLSDGAVELVYATFMTEQKE